MGNPAGKQADSQVDSQPGKAAQAVTEVQQEFPVAHRPPAAERVGQQGQRGARLVRLLAVPAVQCLRVLALVDRVALAEPAVVP